MHYRLWINNLTYSHSRHHHFNESMLKNIDKKYAAVLVAALILAAAGWYKTLFGNITKQKLVSSSSECIVSGQSDSDALTQKDDGNVIFSGCEGFF